jgi:Spy/CpxP family protein refolding chaperone
MNPTERRIRRALPRLRLTTPQAKAVRRLLREEQRVGEAARQLLDECRRELREAFAASDAVAVLELSTQERLLQERQRALAVRLEESIAGVLQPEQALGLRALPAASAAPPERLSA